MIDSFKFDTVSTNATDLRVFSGGSGDTVLLMHGWCGSSHSWRKLAPLLAATYQVVVPDMRGYGDSAKPQDGYDAANAADDMVGVLDVMGVKRAHIVGHDMGAPVALVLADRYPDRVATVTWIDEPVLGFDTERYTAYTDWNHGGYWQFGFNSTPGLAELMYAGREAEFLQLIFGLMTVNKSAVTPDDIEEYARGMRTENGIGGWVGWYRAALETGAQVRAAAERGAATMPFLCVRGDTGVSGLLAEIKQVAPHARTEIIAQCGHLVAEERPNELKALLLEHFGMAT